MDDIYEYYLTENYKDEQLLQYWHEVSRNIENATFVQKSQWFRAYLESELKSSLYFCFIVILRGEKPVAIIPLQYHAKYRFALFLKSWRIFWPHDLGINDLIFNPNEQGQNILTILERYLIRWKEMPWDLLELQDCPQGGAVDTALFQCRPSRSVTVFDHYSKYLSCKSETANSYERLSSKFKRNIRRLRKKLSEKGEISIHMYRELGDLTVAFDEFLVVEASGWKGEGGTSLLHDKPLRSFYQFIMQSFGQEGNCVIHTMKLDGRPIASQFSVISGNTYYMLKIGYDEEFKSMGPGTLLLEETLKFFSNDDVIDSVSFVTGGSWPDKWCPEALEVNNHYLYSGTIKGRICYLLEKNKHHLRAFKRYLNNKRQ